MIYPSADELEKRVGSKYSLVIAVAKRAKQLREGAPKLVESKSTNPITIALEEIAAGKIKIAVPSPEQLEAAREGAADMGAPSRVSAAVELLKAPPEEALSDEVATTREEDEEAEAAPSDSAEETEESRAADEMEEVPTAQPEAEENLLKEEATGIETKV